MRSTARVAAAAAALLCQACPLGPFDFVDTCGGGANMTDPQLGERVETDGTVPFVRLTWKTGTGKGEALPGAYFEEGMFSSETGRTCPFPFQQVRAGGLRELHLLLDPETERSGRIEAECALNFPDRRRFVQCEHPASDDVYILHLRFVLEGDRVSDVRMAQSRRLGPY